MRNSSPHQHDVRSPSPPDNRQPARLRGALSSHTGTNPPSTNSLNQLVGTELALQLAECVRGLLDQGWRTEQVAVVADVLADERQNSNPSGQAYDLVLSGPEAAGVPTRDTSAVMHALLAEATEEVLLVGYVIHNAQILSHLPDGWHRNLSFACGAAWIFAVHSTTHRSPMGWFVGCKDFVTYHWPWEPKPEVFYDPRSLDVPGTHRSSLHAKCVVVDRCAALITSANFTEAAQERNIECGVIMRHGPLVKHSTGTSRRFANRSS